MFLKKKCIKILSDSLILTDHPIKASRPEQGLIYQKRTCHLIDFSCKWTADWDFQRPKESCYHLDPIIKTEKLAKSKIKMIKIIMKVKVIPIVIGSLETIPKGLERGLQCWKSEDEPRPSKLQALLRSIKILRRILKTWEHVQPLRILSKTIS